MMDLVHMVDPIIQQETFLNKERDKKRQYRKRSKATESEISIENDEASEYKDITTLANNMDLTLKYDEDNGMIETHINDDGSTSNYFDKRKLKVAPRSTLQFKVGPHFEKARQLYSVIELNTGKKLNITLCPRIDRGFDFIENEWVGYKRNYFTLVSTFETPDFNLDQFLASSFGIIPRNKNKTNIGDISVELQPIKYFAIKIQARSAEDNSKIELIQHTAKRDKGPHFKPPVFPLIPGPLPQHQIIREASNVRNLAKMKKYDSTFHFHRDKVPNFFSKDSIINTYPEDCIRKVARYERVQFASSMNIKNPLQRNKYFKLHVILGAIIDVQTGDDLEDCSFQSEINSEDTMYKEVFIPIQEMRTPSLIIRGRSPSNYANSKRITMKTSSTPISANKDKYRRKSKQLELDKNRIILSTMDSNSIQGRPSKRNKKNNTLPMVTPTVNNAIKNTRINSRMHSSFQKSAIQNVETLKHIENLIISNPSNNPYILSSLKERESENVNQNSDNIPDSINIKDVELKPLKYFKNEKISLKTSVLPSSIDLSFISNPKISKKEKIIDPIDKDDDLIENFSLTKAERILSNGLSKYLNDERDISSSLDSSFEEGLSLISEGINKLTTQEVPPTREGSSLNLEIIPRLFSGKGSKSENQTMIPLCSSDFDRELLFSENLKKSYPSNLEQHIYELHQQSYQYCMPSEKGNHSYSVEYENRLTTTSFLPTEAIGSHKLFDETSFFEN
ncbi:hypothetical protein TBLA_0D00350 [Henningerozyma blattae CBS 6284]|uniref:NDT80 domain-containing protein n=1 Tax=Henningerozyma blattae (strain ATCC 34711 / CBS 6284 / DSM 70876 / NBRC 10599 / NRRL Y-10934 / UCD 77-7) TaxID=1071380 RepID=I2H2E3_HENB6|nr:hypothetical protein TBLA_0D00350 [Tetrapisispora blattae CBS 6284]CCH60545.1 hypothetical protein TBLA_0D00350 [Tetrapisispora blattae CBS 6284]